MEASQEKGLMSMPGGREKSNPSDWIPRCECSEVHVCIFACIAVLFRLRLL